MGFRRNRILGGAPYRKGAKVPKSAPFLVVFFECIVFFSAKKLSIRSKNCFAKIGGAPCVGGRGKLINLIAF